MDTGSESKLIRCIKRALREVAGDARRLRGEARGDRQGRESMQRERGTGLFICKPKPKAIRYAYSDILSVVLTYLSTCTKTVV